MKKFLPLTALFLSLGIAAPLFAETPAAPKTDKEKLGYALGSDVGSALKKQPFDFDKQFFIAAVRDALTGGQMQMSDAQVKDVLADFSAKMREKQLAAMTPEQRAAMEAQMKAAQTAQEPADPAATEKNKAAGAKFLAMNKAKPGVQTLPDGMQYKVIAEGSGASPTASDSVTVKYRGTLIDGTEFDASEKHGGTATFPVGGVIAGWTEALQKMKVGSKWQLFIPSDLAYGDRSVGGDIQPGSTLIFEVELVAIGK